jgi:hypothetical protein
VRDPYPRLAELRRACGVHKVSLRAMCGLPELYLTTGGTWMAPDPAQRLIFLSGGVFTAQTRERLDQIGAAPLEQPVRAGAAGMGRPGSRRVTGEANLPAM